MFKICFDDGSWMAVRPSGTEPKIKVYYSVQDASRENAEKRFDAISSTMADIIEG